MLLGHSIKCISDLAPNYFMFTTFYALFLLPGASASHFVHLEPSNSSFQIQYHYLFYEVFPKLSGRGGSLTSGQPLGTAHTMTRLCYTTL